MTNPWINLENVGHNRPVSTVYHIPCLHATVPRFASVVASNSNGLRCQVYSTMCGAKDGAHRNFEIMPKS